MKAINELIDVKCVRQLFQHKQQNYPWKTALGTKTKPKCPFNNIFEQLILKVKWPMIKHFYLEFTHAVIK
jgi:hypothetical protein